VNDPEGDSRSSEMAWLSGL